MATSRPKLRRLLRWYSLFALLPAALISLAGLTWIMLFRRGIVRFETFIEHRWLADLLVSPGVYLPEEWFERTVLVFWMEAPDDFIIQELAFFMVVDFLVWAVVLSGVFFLGRLCIWAWRAVRRHSAQAG